jgi:hypothetical protein
VTNNEIVEYAYIMLAALRTPDDAALTRQLKEGVARVARSAGREDGKLACIVAGLLNGYSYSTESDNPETLKRLRTLAADIGARVTELGASSLRFDPPLAH